jgi:hypothetical protein
MLSRVLVAKFLCAIMAFLMITDSVDARRRFGGGSRSSRSDSDSSASRRDRDSSSAGTTRSGIPFFFVGSSGDKIELVYDLPDTDSFAHDGDNYNIGFKYNAKKAYGVTLMSDKKSGTFVLYHRKKYIPYDDKAKELVIHQLGSDPSVAYRAKLSAMPDSQPVPGSEKNDSESSGFGWIGFVLLAGFLFMMKNTITGVFAASRNLLQSSGPPDTSDSDQNSKSVEDRISARLTEMRNENLAPGASTGSYPTAAPSGFGRKSF